MVIRRRRQHQMYWYSVKENPAIVFLVHYKIGIIFAVPLRGKPLRSMPDDMTNYERSNSIECVALSRFSKEYLSKVLNAKTISERKETSQQLLDYLCDKFHISHVQLCVLNSVRPHNDKGQTYGLYSIKKNRVNGLRYGQRITIWNLTAKRGLEVSPKTFADTLLHEFIHHYDEFYLKIDTIHSAGFYKRISDLKAKLSA